MNGRIYDPLLGRFLSADAVVQFPDNLQSFNRYCYVQNNPLRFVDPSGVTLKEGVSGAVEGAAQGVNEAAANITCGQVMQNYESASVLPSILRFFGANELASRAETYGPNSAETPGGDGSNALLDLVGQINAPFEATRGAYNPVAGPYSSPIMTGSQGTDAIGTVTGVVIVNGAAVVGEATGASAVGAKIIKDIHIEAKGQGTIGQLRYRNTPLLRLDYNRYPKSKGQPRLHLNVGPGTSNIHIPLDPRTWFID